MINAGTLAEFEGPIISVDDDEGFHHLLQRVHRRSPLNKPLICLESGEACLEYFEGVLEGKCEMPAIVLVDANMPSMNGFETVSKIRALGTVINLPLIYILSASNNRTDIERAGQVGADCYIEKPFKMSELPIYQQ